jgi:hypothetical protein
MAPRGAAEKERGEVRRIQIGPLAGLLAALLLAGPAPQAPDRRGELLRRIRDLSVYGGAVPVAGGCGEPGEERRDAEVAASPEPGEGTATWDERPPAATSTPEQEM